MLKKTNAHFNKLRKQCEVYEEAKEAYEKQKQELIDTEGWDSENLQALYENKPEFPISAGACKAYHAWRESVRRKETELELGDFLWDDEVTDFVDCLRKAGIKTFIYTNQSTSTMKNLYGFAREGCFMDGFCTIKRVECYCERNFVEDILEIRFVVC